MDVVSVSSQEEKILIEKMALTQEIEAVRSQPFSSKTHRLMYHLKEQKEYTYLAMLWGQFNQYRQYRLKEKKLPIKKRKLSTFRTLKMKKFTT